MLDLPFMLTVVTFSCIGIVVLTSWGLDVGVAAQS